MSNDAQRELILSQLDKGPWLMRHLRNSLKCADRPWSLSKALTQMRKDGAVRYNTFTQSWSLTKAMRDARKGPKA